MTAPQPARISVAGTEPEPAPTDVATPDNKSKQARKPRDTGALRPVKKAEESRNKKKPRKRDQPTAPAPRDLEVEVKLKCESLDVLTAAGVHVEQVETRHFEDNWVFKLPDGNLRKGQYLRVRYRGDGNGSGARREGVLTYKGKSRRTGESAKGKNKGKKVREEIETIVGQPNKMVKILKRLGLKRSFRYQKYRSVHQATLDDGKSVLAMFDETPIGNFLELEGDADTIERVASLLGFTHSDYLASSYVEMQVARCADRGEPLKDMMFREPKKGRERKK